MTRSACTIPDLHRLRPLIVVFDVSAVERGVVR
jgi:hypothetical protein